MWFELAFAVFVPCLGNDCLVIQRCLSSILRGSNMGVTFHASIRVWCVDECYGKCYHTCVHCADITCACFQQCCGVHRQRFDRTLMSNCVLRGSTMEIQALQAWHHCAREHVSENTQRRACLSHNACSGVFVMSLVVYGRVFEGCVRVCSFSCPEQRLFACLCMRCLVAVVALWDSVWFELAFAMCSSNLPLCG